MNTVSIHNPKSEIRNRLEKGNKLDPNAPENVATTVCSLAAEWRQDLDASILEAIIAEDKRVEAFDIADLAGVLFNSRADDAHTKTEELLQRLQKAGQIRMDNNKRFQVSARPN
ncbi:MAG: hypothetical protein WBN75_05595 [Verrucomicrobiia bacterium]|jgi:hypothetical protein